MKIALITNLYPPYARGGAEKVVEMLAHELVSRGDEVEVITSAPWKDVQFGSLFREERGVIVHRVFHWCLYFNGFSSRKPTWLRLINLGWTGKNILFAWAVWNILRERKFDVIHTHNLAGTSFLIPLMIRFLKVRHVHTLHDIQLAIPSGRMMVGEEHEWINRGIFTRLFQWYQKLVWSNVSVVTAPSEWLLKYYTTKKYFKHSETKLIRHYFGVRAAKPTEFPSAHISRERFTYLYVGQIERAKGVLMVIRQFADLRASGEISEDAELIIAGSGSDESIARVMASVCPQISCVGQIDAARITHMMRSADIIIVPSLLYENSPNVVIEALSLGRPVSVSRVGGASELVQATDGGWIVEPNETAWRHHLAWLFKNQRSVIQKVPLLQLPNAVDAFRTTYE